MTAGLWAEEAPPKINLSLRVGAREEGGELHRVASLIAPVLAAADRVIAEPPQEAFCWPRWDKRAKAEPAPAREPSLQILGPFAELLAARLEREGRENSLLAARRAFFAAAEDAPAEALGLAWRLEKRLPPASGFGGGSSDAAATLRLLAPFAPGAALAPAAAALGSDVPAALAARPVWASGTGGELAPVALPETWAVLAWPGRGLSTAEVYQAWDEEQGRAGVFAPPRPPARFDSVAELAEWCREEGNDLSAPAVRLGSGADGPAELLAELQGLSGAHHAAMSGSGSGCFALFADPQSAERGAERLRTWAAAGPLAV